MFDKRLFKEVNSINHYWVKMTAATFAAVILTIFQASYLSEIITGVFIEKKSMRDLVRIIIILILLVLVRSILRCGIEYYNRLCAIEIKGNLRKRLIDTFISQGPVRLKNEKSGTLATLIYDGIEGIEVYFSEFIPQVIIVSIYIPVILIVVFYLDRISGVIMLLTIPLIPLFMILIGKLANESNKKQWKALQLMGGHFLDVLKGLPTLRSFGRSKRQSEIVEQVSENYREKTMKVLKIAFLSALVLELVATISTAIISVSLGIRLLYSFTNFSTAFFILLMTPEYYQPMRELGAKFHTAMTTESIADDIYSRFNKENIKNRVLEKVELNIQKPLKHISIFIKDLRFSYKDGDETLKGLSMEIAYGKKTSLVGQSGSGKSTLAALIMGFINGYSGSIKANSLEINTLLNEKWYENFAYVPQNPKIFKATVLENLKMSKPEAELEEIIKITKITGVDAFVNDLPFGYETIIGEGGVNISGGQAQLISVARACLKNSEFIILDEPTSALDPETENKVNRALEVLLNGKTVLTIAHRIPTIMNSDKIYVIGNGRIIEEGIHEELIRLKGSYYKLLNVWEEII